MCIRDRPFIGKLRQNFGAAIATIGGDGQKLITQKSIGAFAADKATSAERGLSVRDMPAHHLAKLSVRYAPPSQLAVHLGRALYRQLEPFFATFIEIIGVAQSLTGIWEGSLRGG